MCPENPQPDTAEDLLEEVASTEIAEADAPEDPSEPAEANGEPDDPAVGDAESKEDPDGEPAAIVSAAATDPTDPADPAEDLADSEETPEIAPPAEDDASDSAEEAEEDEPDPEALARELEKRLEAILFSSEVPLPAKRLGELSRKAKREVIGAIDRLNVFYGESDRAFRIVEMAGGFRLVTTPDHADLLLRLHKERVPTRLSRAALETLSIIAFKQPATRAEIDAIRGVSASDRVIRHLIERKLVKIAGRAEAPGRPLLYGTTREFLAYFGLAAVGDLPRTPELASLLAGDAPPAPEQESLLPDLEDEIAAKIPATVADVDQEIPQSDPEDADPESHSGEESDGADGTNSP